jgi:hypothetical protein
MYFKGQNLTLTMVVRLHHGQRLRQRVISTRTTLIFHKILSEIIEQAYSGCSNKIIILLLFPMFSSSTSTIFLVIPPPMLDRVPT